MQGEDAAALKQVVGVLGLVDGQDHLLRLKGDLRDQAGREAMTLLSAPATPVI
jgi:hypothetical protein